MVLDLATNLFFFRIIRENKIKQKCADIVFYENEIFHVLKNEFNEFR